jgi:hypothetical protein
VATLGIGASGVAEEIAIDVIAEISVEMNHVDMRKQRNKSTAILTEESRDLKSKRNLMGARASAIISQGVMSTKKVLKAISNKATGKLQLWPPNPWVKKLLDFLSGFFLSSIAP